MYTKEFTKQDQINYVQFDFNLDPHPSAKWQIHIVDLDGNKLRVRAESGTISQDRLVEMVLSGRFNAGFDPSEIYGFWIEKW